MDITKFDKNFKLATVTETDVEWVDVREDNRLSLHGIYYKNGEYIRMPKEVGAAISPWIEEISAYTTGGRLRFVADSPYVAIRCLGRRMDLMTHVSSLLSVGFSIYADGELAGIYMPTVKQIVGAKESIAFDGICRFETKKKRLIELYFPMYGGVHEISIGLQAGSVLKKAPEYAHKKPIVFYGSSITMGACASRPGNDYTAHVCRWLDSDYINLGFSGGAKGENAIVEHLASLDASVYVIDYDHNTPNLEHLEKTHYPLYEGIRKRWKDTPIVFTSKPDFENGIDDNVIRREIIRKTYERAKASGDHNVYFIDGESLFGKEDRVACTVDKCHPNDLGFYRIAKTVYPVLKQILE
ncbi:MAG: hypothetical protein IJX31_03170 [Clostridia bacterium]|nr:hypothetical protein [Clostridia bacterium]